jgi:uncharacterized protein (TIGR02284 family)
MPHVWTDVKERWRARVLLNGLLSACVDEQLEYVSAAQLCRDADEREELTRRSRKRAELAQTLTRRIRALGGDPWGGPSFRGALRRGLRSLRSLVDGAVETHVMQDCARLERETERRYLAALERSLPGPLRTMLAGQLAEISLDRRVTIHRAAE